MSELAFDGTPLHTLLAQDPTPAAAAHTVRGPGPAPCHTAVGQPPTTVPHGFSLLLADRLQQAHVAVLTAHHAIARHQVRLAEESAGTGLDR
ncbi:hypothetical protein [Streptomyces sp. WELS2]|uniref:hypothetical protein n=1 Tax=Streptomyces sp. WELS2 TaxID=2749435 RepID=UPI0015F0411A|nr:hypothetical protein [Streptomyces sp. WELS2]